MLTVVLLALVWTAALFMPVTRKIPLPGADHEEWDETSVVLRRPVVDCVALGWIDWRGPTGPREGTR